MTKQLEDYPELHEWFLKALDLMCDATGENCFHFIYDEVAESKLLELAQQVEKYKKAYQRAMQEFDTKCKRVNKLRHELEQANERVKELEKAEKKAFWWSAEFTHIVHSGKIQSAWEDYNQLNKESN